MISAVSAASNAIKTLNVPHPLPSYHSNLWAICHLTVFCYNKCEKRSHRDSIIKHAAMSEWKSFNFGIDKYLIVFPNLNLWTPGWFYSLLMNSRCHFIFTLSQFLKTPFLGATTVWSQQNNHCLWGSFLSKEDLVSGRKCFFFCCFGNPNLSHWFMFRYKGIEKH